MRAGVGAEVERACESSNADRACAGELLQRRVSCRSSSSGEGRGRCKPAASQEGGSQRTHLEHPTCSAPRASCSAVPALTPPSAGSNTTASPARHARPADADLVLACPSCRPSCAGWTGPPNTIGLPGTHMRPCVCVASKAEVAVWWWWCRAARARIGDEEGAERGGDSEARRSMGWSSGSGARWRRESCRRSSLLSVLARGRGVCGAEDEVKGGRCGRG